MSNNIVYKCEPCRGCVGDSSTNPKEYQQGRCVTCENNNLYEKYQPTPNKMIEVCIGKEGQDIWIKDGLAYTKIDPTQPTIQSYVEQEIAGRDLIHRKNLNTRGERSRE